ncbi:hypothetical protein AQS8620_01756 [Aquimixticola soesokkakensis]|uniref:Lipoprotein n=1 Tax=Aquimixticola soesokkakensis TaxID=1519096 RepID=A0A1Y5SMN1_9RHOB|nr:DUF6778 family protein [Aquimixticola soesokkakensis]SLN44103.1 hypothetical protein AQS8620_01756 [Aquimixticola soesokkakensis]
MGRAGKVDRIFTGKQFTGKLALALALVLGTTACTTVETATRGLPIDTPVTGLQAGAQAYVLPDFNVAKVNITVPRTLEVSEADAYYPKADIVWRGDALGDRYAQVEAILAQGLNAGAATLSGQRAVIVDITLTRFHSLTEKTRHSIGGDHNVIFAMTVRDARSGEVLIPAHMVDGTLNAFGGLDAIRAERAGQTQKVRITDHLAQVIVRELTTPQPI